MASQQKIREAQEKLVDLRLRANLSFAENKSVGTFGKSNDTSTGDPDLWRKLKEEEAAELDAKRRQAPSFKIIADQWSKPVDVLQTTVRLPDVGCQLPLVTQATTVHPSLVEDFIDLQKSRNIVYSKDGILRLILYLETMSRTSQVFDGVTYYVANTLDCWLAADRRLVELNAYGDTERAELFDEPQLEAKELTSNELFQEASSQWLRVFGEIYKQWLASLALPPWNFTPDESQQRAALRYLEQCGVGDALAFDTCRVAMSDAGIFPPLYTTDDLICKKLDSGQWDLSTPAGRAAYARAKNQIMYGTI